MYDLRSCSIELPFRTTLKL